MKIRIIDEADRLRGIVSALGRMLPDAEIRQDLFISSIVVGSWANDPPDVLIVSRHTPLYERSLENWLTQLAHTIPQIIVVTDPVDPPGDPLIQVCVQQQIFDVIQSRTLMVASLVEHIHHPATADALAAYRPADLPLGHPEPIGKRTYFQRRPTLQQAPGAVDAPIPIRAPEPVASPLDWPDNKAHAPRPSAESGATAYMARQLIAVQGLGGGVGTTMMAVQCARRLAQRGRVLLWDWDPRGSVSTWLGTAPPDEHCWETADVPDRYARTPWIHRVWDYAESLHVLTAQGMYPERPILWSDADMDAMLHWAERQYDYVVVDLGHGWDDPRNALVTGLADVCLGITAPYATFGPRALRWLEWVQDNDWRVASRHGWIGIGHHVAPRDQHAWEKVVGERWMVAIDWDQPKRRDDPLARIIHEITQAHWSMVDA